MAVKVGKLTVQSAGTGSGRMKHAGCSNSSRFWWVLRPLEPHNGCVCDFRYGSSVCLPSDGCCLVLWSHLSRRALLTACETPPDGLSWPKHFAKQPLTQKAREVSGIHAITVPAVSVNTLAATERHQHCGDFEFHVSITLRLHFFSLPQADIL